MSFVPSVVLKTAITVFVAALPELFDGHRSRLKAKVIFVFPVTAANWVMVNYWPDFTMLSFLEEDSS
jgi:hypothetical protein